MLFRPLIIIMSVFCIGLGPVLPDLPKIPAVWGHYQHHIDVHGENELSFVEFLVDHFSGTDRHEDEHSQLPLHSAVGFVGASGVAYVGVDVVTSVEPYFTEPTPQTYAQPDAEPPAEPTSKTAKPPRS